MDKVIIRIPLKDVKMFDANEWVKCSAPDFGSGYAFMVRLDFAKVIGLSRNSPSYDTINRRSLIMSLATIFEE